jgi:type IV secretory pathway VirD2 relaxase
MRERAAEIVSPDLGPRTDRQIETRLRAEVEQERFTSLDRGPLREADQGSSARGQSPAKPSAGRLQKLRRLGLAQETAPGRWKLAPDLEPVKRREFTLVPWRPVLERNLGREVSGIAWGDTISWTLCRQWGGPSIG